MEIIKINTISGKAVIGVNAGYSLKDQKAVDLGAIAALCMELADTVEAETGIYVSGALTDGKVFYKNSWGCPEDGENVFVLEADCNPSYSSLEPSEYISQWKQAFIRLVDLLMARLGQSAVTAKIGDEVLYLKNS